MAKLSNAYHSARKFLILPSNAATHNLIQIIVLVFILLQFLNQERTLKVVERDHHISRSHLTMELIHRGQTEDFVRHILLLSRTHDEYDGGLAEGLAVASLIEPSQPDYRERLADYNRLMTSTITTLSYLQTLSLCFEEKICSEEVRPIAIESFRSLSGVLCGVEQLVSASTDAALYRDSYGAYISMFGACPSKDSSSL
ncbi:MAG: hypothetical protein AAFP68_10200 [Pseudomonadota bacterium]